MMHRLRSFCILLLGFSAAALALHAAPPGQPEIDVTGYVIHADLDPATGRIAATAAVTFTALDDLNAVVFGLNNGLQVTQITDGSNAILNSNRNVADSTIRVTPATLLAKGSAATYTFTYAGAPTAATSPVAGSNFAQVADPISILLYPGRWFPTTSLFTDRFTAEIHVTVPSNECVVGSGFSGEQTLPDGRTEFIFNWTKPGFPGTIIAGKFLAPITLPGVPNIRVFVTDKQQDKARDFALTAAKEFEFMTGVFGSAESGRLDVVELPGNSVSAAWAPEIVAIHPDRGNARLLANTVAHQWWGSEISPATLDDAWIANGMSRYAELMFLEGTAGKAALQAAIPDIEAGALAYDTDPLTTMDRLSPFSPQFQSMTLEKGAMVFHMLRWEMGDAVFQQFLRAMLSQYGGKPIRTADAEKIAAAQSHLDLHAFFSQWLDGTGAPEYGNNYSVFRLGDNRGFRTIGSITQDLDLFSMPIELRIETEGKTEDRRVDLSGPERSYSIETFGRPRRITLDPDNWLLKSTPDLAVREAILRGQQDIAQGDLMGAIAEYRKALDINRGSALTNYRLAEIFMTQRNYQAAANSFRDALRGDGDPKWVEVWSHINLGKIFDIAGQRQRAVNEYGMALQTNDNTQGALNEARALMQKPYKAEQPPAE